MIETTLTLWAALVVWSDSTGLLNTRLGLTLRACVRAGERGERAWVCSDKQPDERFSPVRRVGGCGSQSMGRTCSTLLHDGLSCMMRWHEVNMRVQRPVGFNYLYLHTAKYINFVIPRLCVTKRKRNKDRCYKKVYHKLKKKIAGQFKLFLRIY